MVRELVEERTADAGKERLGTLPVWDVCPQNCCPSPQRPSSSRGAA
jgi:ferrochelatase